MGGSPFKVCKGFRVLGFRGLSRCLWDLGLRGSVRFLEGLGFRGHLRFLERLVPFWTRGWGLAVWEWDFRVSLGRGDGREKNTLRV